MFTGIIEEIGTVRDIRMLAPGARISVSCSSIWDELKIGDSVAVNGVCLTVVEKNRGEFVSDISEESLERSNLGGLDRGSAVNLERALSLGERLGGHIVQGHVDGVGKATEIKRSGQGCVYSFSAPPQVMGYLVEKGSVAVNGISLTVSALGDGRVSVAAIPHTIENTNLGGIKPGDEVNLEVDILAKYVYSYMRRGINGTDYTGESDASLREKLVEGGFM